MLFFGHSLECATSRHVSRDGCSTDQGTAVRPNGVYRRLDGRFGVVTVARFDLKLDHVHDVPARQALQHRRHFGGRSGGGERSDVAAEHLVGGVAEQLLCPAVPARHESCQIHADNGVARRLHDRREPRHRRFRSLALADVGADEHDADKLGVAVENRGHEHQDRHRRSVTLMHDELVDNFPAALELCHEAVELFVGRLDRDAFDQVAPDHVVGLVPEKELRSAIPVDDAKLDVGGDDRLADRPEQPRLEFDTLGRGPDAHGVSPL